MPANLMLFVKAAAYAAAAFGVMKILPAGTARTVVVVILAGAAVRSAVRPLPVIGPFVGSDI